jgi:hypothetical protein
LIVWSDADASAMVDELGRSATLPEACVRIYRRLRKPLTRHTLTSVLRRLGMKPPSSYLGKSRPAIVIPGFPKDGKWAGADVIELDYDDERTDEVETRAPVEPDSPKYVPHPSRGPAAKPHYIPEGHELGGVSRLTDASGGTLQEWSKTRVAGADEPPSPIPESFLLDKASVMRRGDGSTVVEWSSYKRDAAASWEDIKAAVSAHVAEYVRPADPVDAPQATDAERLVVYPIGDPHIGMLAWAAEVGESFDLKIAQRELCECVQQLVARSPATDHAIVCNLGDFWHAQDDSQRTPKSGNKLDVDGRFGKVGKVGLSIFRSLIDTALTRHRTVKVRSIPGNHDPSSSVWLPLCLQAAYEHEPRVVVEDGFSPYQYDVFGKVLLGWAHGDGAKLEHLGEIMATDVPELWGAASFRYWNTGHIHHWSQKELRGCVVDTHRTLAGPDAWHNHSGYRSGRALKAVAYHHLYGLDSVAVIGVERVRAALSTETK